MSTRLVSQPSAAPTRKVGSAALAGALVTFLVSVLNRTVEAGFTVEEAGALVVIASFLVSYIVRERDHPDAIGT